MTEGFLYGAVFIVATLLCLWVVLKELLPQSIHRGKDMPSDRSPWVDEGTNTRDKARKWAVNDINRACREVVIVTGKGGNNFWGQEDVLNALSNAYSKKAKIIFIFGPNFDKARVSKEIKMSNSNLLEWAKEKPFVELRKLEEHPCAGLRLIDETGTYTCEYKPDFHVSNEENQDNRKYLRTWHVRKVARMQKNIVKNYINHSVPVNV